MFLKILFYLFIVSVLYKLFHYNDWKRYLVFKSKKDVSAIEFINSLSNFIMQKKYAKRDSREEENNVLLNYKYYRDLVLGLWGISRNYGGPIFSVMEDIKSGVIKESRFDKRIKKEKQSAFFQIILMSLVIWSFILITSSMLALEGMQKIYPVLIFMHLLGPIAFLTLFNLIERKIFNNFPTYFNSFYTFFGLLQTGLPLSRSLGISKMDEILEQMKGKFIVIRDQFKLLLKQVQEDGRPIQADLRELINDLWFIKELSLEDFQKSLKVLKFLVLVLFYFTSYFIFLFQIVISLGKSF